MSQAPTCILLIESNPDRARQCVARLSVLFPDSHVDVVKDRSQSNTWLATHNGMVIDRYGVTELADAVLASQTDEMKGLLGAVSKMSIDLENNTQITEKLNKTIHGGNGGKSVLSRLLRLEILMGIGVAIVGVVGSGIILALIEYLRGLGK